jgi:hypothetical protein
LHAQLGFLSAQSFLCKSYFTAGCELRLGFFHELSGLAAVALSQIGGEKALAILERAARREKDKELAIDFRNLLKNLNNSNKPKL